MCDLRGPPIPIDCKSTVNPLRRWREVTELLSDVFVILTLAADDLALRRCSNLLERIAVIPGLT